MPHFPLLRPLLAATTLLMLGACANPSAETIAWARDSATTEDARADLHACTIDAQAQANREHDAQGLAGQQPTDVGASIDSFNQDKRVDELTRQCMLLRGYHAVTAGTN
jgi:hypothetical protein